TSPETTVPATGSRSWPGRPPTARATASSPKASPAPLSGRVRNAVAGTDAARSASPPARHTATPSGRSRPPAAAAGSASIPAIPGLQEATRNDQYVARPPEMSKQNPVVKLHSPLLRKWTSAATSSGLPVRPSGIFESIMLICSWLSWSRIGVWITAGDTLLTQMSPLPTSSFDSDFVSAITAALLAEYGPILGFPSLPAMLAMFTIRPYFLSIISGNTALQHNTRPVTLMLNTNSQSSRTDSQIGTSRPFRLATPAL